MESPLFREMHNTRTARGQSYLFGCKLVAGKSRAFTLSEKSHDKQEFLSLHSISVGASAPDELHVLEISAMGFEKEQISVPVAALRPSVQPSIALHGLELHPPVKLHLLAGAGPLHVCGQYIVENQYYNEEEDEEFEEDDEEDEEEEEEEEEGMEGSDDVLLVKKEVTPLKLLNAKDPQSFRRIRRVIGGILDKSQIPATFRRASVLDNWSMNDFGPKHSLANPHKGVPGKKQQKPIVAPSTSTTTKQVEQEHDVESKPTGNTPKRPKLSQPQEQKAKPKGSVKGKK